jgi:hypothetical protein
MTNSKWSQSAARKRYPICYLRFAIPARPSLGGAPRPTRARLTSPRLSPLHVLDHIIPELGTFDLSGSGRQSRKIIGNPFAGDGPVETLEDQIRGFAPS